MNLNRWEQEALALDAADPLRALRAEFFCPPGVIYLDGNSLGLLCRPAEQALLETLEQWRVRAVGGWWGADPPWFTLAEGLAETLAPLVGADPSEVTVANSTTVNLHQLLATLYRPDARRRRILLDELCFPTDGYAVASFLRRLGLDPERDLVRVPGRDGALVDEDAIVDALDDTVQLAVLPSVHYTSGQLLDLERLAGIARSRKVCLGFDCSHSVGVVPHEFSRWGVDFAFWCHYKYLNGGPGAPAGLYLHRRHFDRPPGLAGWWGSDKSRQFEMAPAFTPAQGAGGLQIGTPSILALAPLRGALELTRRAGIAAIREKSLALTGFLLRLADAVLAPAGFSVVTPRAPERRGGHVALHHPRAAEFCGALVQAGVVPDFRPPALLRLAPAPLYVGFAECLEAVRRLAEISAAA